MSQLDQPESLRTPNQWSSLVRMFSKPYDLLKTEETTTEVENEMEFQSDYSSDEELDEAELGMRQKTTVRTKIRRIKEHSATKRGKIKNNKSIRDWWVWYWQAPKARFPFLYFLVLFISCIPFSVYWFMDNDSSFITCGIVALTMCIYAAHKFRLSIHLKQQVDKYKQLNAKFSKEQRILQKELSRATHAHKVLRHTKKRLSRANAKNRHNLKRFENVENNLRIMGKEAGEKLKNVSELTQSVRRKWREELLGNERELLHTVYNRFEKLHTGKSQLGLSLEDFKQFEEMLPKRYGQRFDRLGTFHAFAGDRKCINPDDFANTLDTFAVMETDDTDIDFILAPTESMHPHVSSFRFTTSRELWDGDLEDFNSLRVQKSAEKEKQQQKTLKKRRKKSQQVLFRK